jgi:hypothetical protein
MESFGATTRLAGIFFWLFLSRAPIGARSIPSGCEQKIPALVLGIVLRLGAILSNPFNPLHPDETSVCVARRTLRQ